MFFQEITLMTQSIKKRKNGGSLIFSRIAFKKRRITGHLYKKRRFPLFWPPFFLWDDFPSLKIKGDERVIEWPKKEAGWAAVKPPFLTPPFAAAQRSLYEKEKRNFQGRGVGTRASGGRTVP